MKCKSLQKTSNLVRAKVEKLNEADMSRRFCQLVDINRLRESKFPHGIPVQYMSYTCTTIHCTQGLAFQSATQTVYSFAEDVTSKRLIIKMVTNNKICSKHGHLLDESNINHSYSSRGLWNTHWLLKGWQASSLRVVTR